MSEVVLQGVRISTCTRCGECSVAIPRVEELHEVIAEALAKWPRRLAPREIRFLRKHLGWSSRQFATEMGVASETVSRWEHGAARMELPTERLLRLYVLCQRPARRNPVETLEELGRTGKRPIVPSRFSAVLRDRGSAWRIESPGPERAAT